MPNQDDLFEQLMPGTRASLDHVMIYAHLAKMITGETFEASWLPEHVETLESNR